MRSDVDPEVMRTARYVRDNIYENGFPAVKFTLAGRKAIEQVASDTIEDNIHRNLK